MTGASAGELTVRPADVEPHTVYLVRMLGRHGNGTFTYAATGFDPRVGVREGAARSADAGRSGWARWDVLRRRSIRPLPPLRVELHAVPLPAGVDVWPPHLDPALRHRLTGGHPTSWRWLDTIRTGDYPVAVLAARCCTRAEWPQVAESLLAKRLAAEPAPGAVVPPAPAQRPDRVGRFEPTAALGRQ